MFVGNDGLLFVRMVLFRSPINKEVNILDKSSVSNVYCMLQR
jgi:hypothetical protein